MEVSQRERVCRERMICHFAMILSSVHCHWWRTGQVIVASLVWTCVTTNWTDWTHLKWFNSIWLVMPSRCASWFCYGVKLGLQTCDLTSDTSDTKADQRYFRGICFLCLRRSHGDQNWGMLFLQGLNKPVVSCWHCMLCPIPPSSLGSDWPQGLKPRLDSRVSSPESRPGSEITKLSCSVTRILI